MPNEESPTLTVEVNEEDHIQGADSAQITLVEYGDYQCPYCRKAHPIVKKIQETLGDKLRFVFRDFPLRKIHPNAEHAAEASEIAAAHGKFWEMHDLLYENQKSLEDENLIEYAESLGIDREKFAADLENGTYQKKVRDEFISGIESGVNATPTFFINGVRFDGSWDYDSLLEALENAA